MKQEHLSKESEPSLSYSALDKPRLLSGDTPTGKLHLGHWVGSIEERVRLQDECDCYFIIANLQALTTRINQPNIVYQSVIDIILDYLAVGIDPIKSTIFLQSEIPELAELTLLFSMLVSYGRLMRNPTIKDEIHFKGLGKHYSVGFLLYPISQIADILAFKPTIVPVGEDQLPHLEMAREVARRFNHLYCHVDHTVDDQDHIAAGGLFPILEARVGRVRRLVGIGPPLSGSSFGNDLIEKPLKMSKSLNNAIFLSDDPDTVRKKVMLMYTDPKRLRATDPGTIEHNPLWIFHDAFNPDMSWVQTAKERYQAGEISDVECKKRLIDVLIMLIEPMRQRRLQYAKDLSYILSILKEGTQKANVIVNATLLSVKEAIKQRYF